MIKPLKLISALALALSMTLPPSVEAQNQKSSDDGLALENIDNVSGTFNKSEAVFAATGRVEQNLSNFQWKMKMMLPGEGVKQGLHDLFPEDKEISAWNPASVPGDVYTDLWIAGGIDDPYYGRNTIKSQWVQHYEWWYALQFKMNKDVTGKHARIYFDGVDYSCEVWLNGHYLGSHEGAFDGFSFEVGDYLRVGNDNRSGANMLTVKLNPPTHVNTVLAGMKTPWFGDYWRDLIPFGIWRPVRMVVTDAVRIEDTFARTSLNSDGSANIDMEVTLNNSSSTIRELNVTASIEGKNFESKPQSVTFDCEVPAGKHTFTKRIHVKKPELWWPWDMGKPNLYEATIVTSEGGKKHDTDIFSFGIREVTMEWNPGFEKGVDVSFPRTTVINGKPMFIRSACWGGPPNIFVGRTSDEMYEKLLTLAKDANLNNIRIFGWHNPEIPHFYEICDSLGLTVWQDMVPLGSGNIPKDKERTDRIIESGIYVAKERRNYPSLIMMEGGEEYFLRTRDVEYANNFLLQLGDSLQKYLPLPYVPDSPLTCDASQEAGYKPKEAHHALAYFYGMGNWLAEDWYQRLDYPIIPEFAITSAPSVESISKFIPEEEMWPPGLSWGHHWADLVRLKMQNFDIFGNEMANGTLEEFVNATQDAQGVIFQNGIEYFRRNKPRLSGVSLCHWITYWPDMKWGIIDAYQQPKRSYDFVKRAFQPLLVNLEFKRRRWHNDENFEGAIWVINDLYKEYKGTRATMVVKDDSGNIVKSESFDVKQIGENSAFKVVDINWDVLSSSKERFYVELTLMDSKGEELSSNEYFFLIGDQAEASAQFKQMGIKRSSGVENFTYGNYLRFYPEVLKKLYNTQTMTPRAEGFGGNE